MSNSYRSQQFKKLKICSSEFLPAIKIRTDEESTNWLSITDKELLGIISMLIESEEK